MRVRRTALGGRFATHRSLVPQQRLQGFSAPPIAPQQRPHPRHQPFGIKRLE